MSARPVTYRHDGSFEGMLCAVAAAARDNSARFGGIFDRKQSPPGLFDEELVIRTDRQQAGRLFAYLKKLGKPAPQFALNGYLSEDRLAAGYLYSLVRKSLSVGAVVLQRREYEYICHLEDLCRKVYREAHRFYGLLRFTVLEDGLQYAPCAPAHNIIGYLARHFSRRLASKCWLIHDIERNVALHWDTNEIQPVQISEQFSRHVRHCGSVPEAMLAREELDVRQLWRSFHTAIVNRARINLRLQQNHMPKKYWNYLAEMQHYHK
jgi:probable DNA metabolism protein